MIIELEFPPSESCLKFSGKFKINDENPLNSIENFIKDFEDEGYFLTFSRHFNLIFLLKSQNSGPLKESEEEREEENEEKREEPVINTEQTFKENECVICLTNPLNVLFCNCGHIVICVKCDVVEGLKVCPKCKTENIIKRMIE